MDEVGKSGCPNCGDKPICGYWSLEAKAHYMGAAFYVVLLQLEYIIKVRGEFIEYAGRTTWQQVRRKFDRQPSLWIVLNIVRVSKA